MAEAHAGGGGADGRPAALGGRLLAAVALGAGLLYLPALGAHDLWNPDEPRYAQVTREMLDRGDLLVPYLNGEIYTQKPPLFFWAVAAASLPFGGVTETSARLPSALAAIGAVLLTCALGARLFGRRAGLLAGAAFATCATTLWHGRFGQIDMTLTALVALALWFWLRGWSEDRRGFYWLFFAVTGVATVTKGPAGMLPPLLAVVAFFALTRRWRDLRRLRVGRGLLLWALVVAAWLLPAAIAGGESYWRELVFHQNLTRYATPWHHYQPWYHYLTVVPAEFFPWSLLLPAALVAGWRRLVRPHGVVAERAGRMPADGFLFALCWVVATIVFFSISPAKRSVYVLTCYPGLALVVGAGLDRLAAAWSEGGRGLHRAWLAVPCALVATIGLGGAAALVVEGGGRPELELLGQGFLWVGAGALAALGLAAAAALALALARRAGAMAGALAAGMAALALALAVYLLPAFDVLKSVRPLAERFLEASASGEPFAVLPHLDPALLFYTGRRAVPVGEEGALESFLERPGRLWLFAERDDVARRGIDVAALGLAEVARDNDPDNGYVLYRRDPSSAP